MQAYVSLWSADLLALGEAVDSVDEVVDGYHIDVFDGHNVPELLFGPDFVAALRRRTARLIDVHLNVTDPDGWARRFIEVGADMVTLQSGPSPDIRSSLHEIRRQGAKASLGLEIHEPPSHAVSLFDSTDRVLLMGTAIGIRGVGLDPSAASRIQELVGRRADAARTAEDLPVFVDGGIRNHTVSELAEAGADGVIPGSLVFGTPDPSATVERLHHL